jgi:type IV secretory pathway VirB2 component (pilin)
MDAVKHAARGGHLEPPECTPATRAFGFYLSRRRIPSCSESESHCEREGVIMQAIIQNVAVKSFMALERGQTWATSGEFTHKKAFLLGMGIAVAMTAGSALAQATPPAAPPAAPVGAGTVGTTLNPIDAVRKSICTIAGVLQGPIGIGVIIACVVIAGLSMAFGGKNSTSLLISALVGATIIFGARVLIGFVSGQTLGTCDIT